MTERRVTGLCRAGDIVGAVKNGKSWEIPVDAERPVDNRIKTEKNCTEKALKDLSLTALKQINDKKYDTEMRTSGVKTIYKFGVAFSGKKVEVQVG